MNNKEYLADITFYIIFGIMFVFICIYGMVTDYKELDNSKRQINELQNKVEQQYELIDALQQ